MTQWRQDLQCEVLDLHYDFNNRRGSIYFPVGNCCDMGGCLKLFQAIDPGVRFIQTYSGTKHDTAYRLTGREWEALTCGPGFPGQPDGDTLDKRVWERADQQTQQAYQARSIACNLKLP